MSADGAVQDTPVIPAGPGVVHVLPPQHRSDAFERFEALLRPQQDGSMLLLARGTSMIPDGIVEGEPLNVTHVDDDGAEHTAYGATVIERVVGSLAGLRIEFDGTSSTWWERDAQRFTSDEPYVVSLFKEDHRSKAIVADVSLTGARLHLVAATLPEEIERVTISHTPMGNHETHMLEADVMWNRGGMIGVRFDDGQRLRVARLVSSVRANGPEEQ